MSRRKQSRKLSKRFAIICEGKTEWHYFNGLKRESDSDSNFSINPSIPKHTDWLNILRRAIDKVDDGYDLVFCVFDFDVIQNDATIQKTYLDKKKKIKDDRIYGEKIIFTHTMPCIEYWFLLHFIAYSSRRYSDCSEAENKLKAYLENYSKSRNYLKGLYKILERKGDVENALSNAKKLRRERKKSGIANRFPFSNMDKLIDRLNTL